MLNDLKNLKKLYDDGINIIGYIKKNSDYDKNTSEMIMISYDFQAGSYIKKHRRIQNGRMNFQALVQRC